MAKNCVNLELPEVKELHQQLVAGVTFSDITPEIVGANIALWQERNNTENFPTLEELEDFMSVESLVPANGGERETISNTPLDQLPPEMFISQFEKAFRNPIERANRVNLVTSLFGQYITALINREAEERGVDPSSINRLEFIRKYGPDNILAEAKAVAVDPYITNGGNVDAIWDAVEINFPEYTEEQIEEEVLNIQASYDKVSKFYWDLVGAARSKLRRAEGLKVKDVTEQEEVEDNPKEQFGLDITTISGYESLSALSRHFLSTIPIVDQDGVFSLDDMLQVRYLEPDFTYAKIVELLPGTKNSTEMIERLEENVTIYPWLAGVVDRLSEDNNLATTLFSNMNKAFMPYDVITKDKDAITLNMNNSVRTFLAAINRNLLSGSSISKDSIYDTSSKIDREKVKAVLSKTTEALKPYTSLRAANYSTYLSDSNNRNNVAEALSNAYRAIGFPVTKEDIEAIIIDRLDALNPLSSIWFPLQTLLNRIQKDKNLSDTAELLQTYSAAFNNLADNFRFRNQSTETGTRDGNKNRYSYVMPSYLSDLVGDIKDDSKRESILYEKFAKYPFFYDASTGRYYNDWLEILSKPGREHMRTNFRYKNVLHDDKGKRYSQWTVPDHINVMLSEFGAFFDSKGGERPSYSGYMMPTMSDAETVLYLQAPRYDSDITTYQEKILTNLESVVYQEIIKINDIRDRAKRRAAGEDIPIIEYYDGHPEFTAIPQLNSYKTEDGKTFLEKYAELQNDKTALSDWIRGVLNPIMADEFNYFMRYLQNNGVFSDNVGKFTKDKFGVESFKRAVSSFEQAILSTDPIFLEDPVVNKLFEEAKNVNMLTSDEDISRIEIGLNEYGETLGLSTEGIRFVSPLKETLRHFFWNDYLANIYMVQMLTTSTQFYGSDVKFYKRGKEWYAATRKLDTAVKSTLRMAIVSDVESIVPDEYKSSIDKLYNQLVEDGKITKDIKGRLMEAMKSINETDGEAFMTLDAYRDMMLASAPELWTDNYESVYQKLTGKNSTPMTSEELGVIFQIIKPFVYTQIDMSNGGKDATLPLPYQNKNSIMVLTPNLVRNNPKLQGVLDFMTDNSLDMLQFESAVKVGIQGKLNIEGSTGAEIRDNLNSQYLVEGQPRGGYLYTIDSRNFGIQQETPPHYLDTATNIAVQMKRITMSYMSAEDKAEVDNITIQNSKEAYEDLRDLYTSPGKMYKMISESLKDDGRASNDTIKAVTPDASGNTPIPICNPLTDGVIAPRVIAPFKQVIKQMISGGALIQATSLGKGTEFKGIGDDSLGIKFNEETGAIEYIECLMSATYKDIIASIVNRDSGELDIDAKDENGNLIVPEEMRRIIAFRIPSEGANSVIPLRIKGFLPVSAGGMIVTNPLVFPLTGSDLDVDKLFFYKKAHHLENGKMVVDTEGKTGRDNKYFDLMYKAITSVEYTKDMINFSNFEEQKRAARIMEILSDPSIEQKYKNLSILEKMSTKELTALTERAVSLGGIASSISKLTSAVRNMTGKNLIAMIANQSSNAILLRDYKSPVSNRFHFTIDTTPFNMINVENTYLAVKQYLAAVVDNAKDPVLGSLGANMDTINALMAMVRAGFSPVQIGLLFNQPSFRGALNEYEKSGRKKRITKFIEEYKKTLAKRLNVDTSTIDTSLTSKELVDNMTGLKEKDADSYYRTQLKVLENISRLFQVGDYLSEYVSVSRYDSTNSAPSVSVESIYSESERVRNFYNKKPLIKLPKLTQAVYSGEEALKTLEGDTFPVVKYIQAMYGLSYGGAIDLLSQYYPQLNPFFAGIRNSIGISSRRKELSNREIKLVNSAVMEYLLSERAFPVEQRAYFTEGKFIDDLIGLLKTDKSLDENYLVRDLTILKNGKVGIEDVGGINPVARERYTDAWRGLVMSDNPIYKRLGLDLMRYCAYNYGVKFAPGSFIHLAPIEAQLLLPGYVESLRDIASDMYSDSSGFLPQFYLNNASSDNLVPQVPSVENLLFRSDDEIENGFILPSSPPENISDEASDILYPEDGLAPGAFKVQKDNKWDIYVRYKLEETGSGISSYYQRVNPINTNRATYSYGKSINDFINSTKKTEIITENSIEDAMQSIVDQVGEYEGIDIDLELPFDINAVDQIQSAMDELANLDFDAIEASLENAQFDNIPEIDECKSI